MDKIDPSLLNQAPGDMSDSQAPQRKYKVTRGLRHRTTVNLDHSAFTSTYSAPSQVRTNFDSDDDEDEATSDARLKVTQASQAIREEAALNGDDTVAQPLFEADSERKKNRENLRASLDYILEHLDDTDELRHIDVVKFAQALGTQVWDETHGQYATGDYQGDLDDLEVDLSTQPSEWNRTYHDQPLTACERFYPLLEDLGGKHVFLQDVDDLLNYNINTYLQPEALWSGKRVHDDAAGGLHDEPTYGVVDTMLQKDVFPYKNNNNNNKTGFVQSCGCWPTLEQPSYLDADDAYCAQNWGETLSTTHQEPIIIQLRANTGRTLILPTPTMAT